MFRTQILPELHPPKWLIALLVGVMLAAPIAVQTVDAARMVCRSDPIVFLSDGTRLQFDAAIETALENIQGIHYELHVPVGVSIDRIIFTPKWAREIETVELIADQAPGNYVIVAYFDVAGDDVRVNLRGMHVARGNGGQGSTHQTVSGHTGEVLTLQFSP